MQSAMRARMIDLICVFVGRLVIGIQLLVMQPLKGGGGGSMLGEGGEA